MVDPLVAVAVVTVVAAAAVIVDVAVVLLSHSDITPDAIPLWRDKKTLADPGGLEEMAVCL